jgi:hypothetical protein
MEELTKNLCRHPCFTIRVVFNWQFYNVLEALWFQGFPDHNRHLFVTSIINTQQHSESVFGMFSSMASFSFIRQGSIRKHVEE